MASDLGYLDMAKQSFDEIAEADFELPVDAKRSATLSYLAETCVALGDARRAGALYALLLPYRRANITIGIGTICCGAAARFLGMLASLLEDWEVAAEHFEAAIAMDTGMRAWPWLAHTQHEFAAMLRRRGRLSDLIQVEHLRSEALATSTKLGMVALQGRLRSELD